MRLTATILLACVAMPLLARTAPEPTNSAGDAVAADWGVLGEMAGRDFEGKNFFLNVRWVVPGKHLTLDHWMGDWSGNFRTRWEVIRDPATGNFGYFYEGRQGKDDFELRVEADGTVLAGQRGRKLRAWFAPTAEGGFAWEGKALAPLDPVGKLGRRMAKLVAEGRIDRAGTARESASGAPNQVSISSATPVARGIPAPPAELSAQAIEARKAKWGSLAQIPGKSWYCVGGNPAQWFARKRVESGYGFSYNRSSPVIRLTTGEWLEPYSSLKITTTLGDGRRWVDTINLQPDGSFLMVTEGVQAFSRVRGYSDGWTVTFPLGKYGTYQNKLTFGGYQGIPVYELASGTFGDDARCFMQTANSPEEAARFKTQFLDAMRDFNEKSSQIPAIQADMAEDRARGEQMRGNMQAGLLGAIVGGGGSGPVAYFPNTASISGATGSSFYEQLTAMADQAQREAEQSRRRLDQSIASGLASNGGLTAPKSAAGTADAPSASGGLTVASNEPAGVIPPAARPSTPTSTPVAVANPRPSAPSAPEMCTAPGGSREWSTGGLSSLEDAQASYEQEAAFQRSKGSSMGPMRASGKTITVFGQPHANYVATITWPAKSVPCSSKVSPQ